MKPEKAKPKRKTIESKESSSLLGKLDDTRKELSLILGVTALLVALVTTTSLSAVFAQLLNSPIKTVNEEGIVNLWDYFKLTAPLTLAVGMLVVSAIRDWFGGFFGRFFAFSVTLALTTLLLQPDGVSMLTKVANTHQSSVFGYPVQLVIEYLKLYWWQAFVCSLIIGTALGFIIHRILARVNGE